LYSLNFDLVITCTTSLKRRESKRKGSQTFKRRRSETHNSYGDMVRGSARVVSRIGGERTGPKEKKKGGKRNTWRNKRGGRGVPICISGQSK